MAGQATAGGGISESVMRLRLRAGLRRACRIRTECRVRRRIVRAPAVVLRGGVSDESHDERRDADPADRRKPARRTEQVGERSQVPMPPEVDERERQHGGGQHPAEGPEDQDGEELGERLEHRESCLPEADDNGVGEDLYGERLAVAFQSAPRELHHVPFAAVEPVGGQFASARHLRAQFRERGFFAPASHCPIMRHKAPDNY